MALSKIKSSSVEDTAIYGRRNLIINGAMQVAQRGTSVTGQTAVAYHTVDRWQSSGSGSTYNQSQQSVTLGDSTVGAFKYFLRHEVTTANDFAGLLSKIEDVQSVPEGTVTLSFYAKGINPGGGQLQVRGRQNFGTGGSPSSQVIGTAQALVLTSSWQRFTYTFNVPSISGKTLGTDANSSFYRIDIQQPGDDDTTDAWTLDITGVQLELGETATPFEHRSYGEELALCQRYYQVLAKAGSTNHNIGTGYYYDSSTLMVVPRFAKEMRAAPTLVQGSGSDYWFIQRSGGTDSFNSLTIQYATINSCNFYNNTQASGSSGASGRIGTNNTGAYAHLDAEL